MTSSLSFSPQSSAAVSSLPHLSLLHLFPLPSGCLSSQLTNNNFLLLNNFSHIKHGASNICVFVFAYLFLHFLYVCHLIYSISVCICFRPWPSVYLILAHHATFPTNIKQTLGQWLWLSWHSDRLGYQSFGVRIQS